MHASLSDGSDRLSALQRCHQNSARRDRRRSISSLKHILRARIVLISAEHVNVKKVARRVGVSRSAVCRWQQRFDEEGVEGLKRDKICLFGTPPHSTRTVAKMLAQTCAEPSDDVTHWTGRAVASRSGFPCAPCN